MVLGNIVRLQHEADGVWHKINKERSCVLELRTEYAECAGSGRGKKMGRRLKKWSAEVSLLLTDEADFESVWNEVGKAASAWRIVCKDKAWRGSAFVSSLEMEAGKRSIVTVQIGLTGTGKLEEVAL